MRKPAHITAHPQRGALFENWIMTELLKAQTNLGIKPSLHFLRDKEGHEIDALIKTAPGTFHAIEIKSGETIASDFFSGLDYWRAKLPHQTHTPWLIHGGTARQDREKATVLPCAPGRAEAVVAGRLTTPEKITENPSCYFQ